MTPSPRKVGNTFTKYSVIIVGVIVVLAILLFLAGDFVYSQIRPEKPTVTTPATNTTIGKNPPTFEGEMPVAAAIEIILDGKKVATRTPENQTIWNFTPDTQLSIGKHTLAVVAISAEGIRSKPSDEVTFTVPKKPQITSYYDTQVFVNQAPKFEGEAEANTEVDLYIDNVFVASTKSNEQGKWQFEKVPTIVIGQHTAKVVAVKTIGEFQNESAPLAFTLQRSLE